MASSSSGSDSDSEFDELVETAFTEVKSSLDKRNTQSNVFKSKIIVDPKDKSSSLFVIDNKPASSSSSRNETALITHTSTNKTRETLYSSDSSDDDVKNNARKTKRDQVKKKPSTKLASSLQVSADLSDLYVDVKITKKTQSVSASSRKVRCMADRDAEVMKKSVISPDIERKFVIPPYQESFRQEKKQRKLEREKTKGKGWFGLPATELDDEKKNDLLAIQMRRALDPKRFYKANDLKGLPKYYQFGTVIENATEFYSARIPKKQRKKTVVDELLADAQFRKYNKRKYSEIQDAKRRGAGPYQHIKRVKKRNK